MIGFLKRILGGGGDAPAGPRPGGKTFSAPLEVDRATYAVGDIHGRFDLMTVLLDRIRADAAARGFDAPRLVLLGDYVDRGEQSAQVLRRVRALLDGDWPGEVRALRGNHEEMLLDFVDAPETAGQRFVRNGGLQTLLSFGVGGALPTSEPAELVEPAARLAEAAADVLPMVRALPAWAVFGNLLCVHAGADPELPPDLQSERTMTWGTPRFFQMPRTDGLWCVYGHYVVDEAGAAQGRVAVDTGAYHSGVLSAARFADGEVGFLTSG